MKVSDLFFNKKLDEIQRALLAHDQRVTDTLDRIEDSLKLLLQDDSKHVSKELEKAVKEVAARVVSIDKKVKDSPEQPTKPPKGK